MVTSVSRGKPASPPVRRSLALPIGSGVLIALSFGLTVWYGMARLLTWIAHGLT